MSRHVMSQAELNAAPRLTPTQWAEDAYQSQKQRRAKAQTGPAGLPIPTAGSGYRPTIDGPLLVNIARHAYADWRAEQLPQARIHEVAALLLADLRERFPAADMGVLRRYGLVEQTGRVIVDMTVNLYEKPATFSLPETVETAPGGFRYRWKMEGQGAPVPAATESYFETVAAVRRAEQPDFMKVIGWPSQFKVKRKRWPAWREIEAAWPLIGSWMAGQRSAA